MSLTVGILKTALKGLDENLLVVVKNQDDSYTPACSANIEIQDIDFGDFIEECLLINPCNCENENLPNLN